MINHTTFISRKIAENIRHDLKIKTSLISINSPLETPGASPVDLHESSWKKILRLEFHDADQSGLRDGRVLSKSEIKMFDEEMALKVINFLKEVEEECESLIVHCEGGISRSAAVSKFIARLYNLDFPEHYSLYNRHVFSTLLKVYGICQWGDASVYGDSAPSGDLPGV